jgi:hypothetical protein
MKKVVWILVNYNCTHDIHLLVEKHCNGIDFVVIDNSGEYVVLDREILLSPSSNLGYIGALQHALDHLGSRVDEEYIIFSNADVVVEKDIINKLLGLSLGFVYAPSITNLDGNSQNPHLVVKPTGIKIFVFYLITLIPLVWLFYTSMLRRKSTSQSTKSAPGKIYAGHGSFLIFAGVDLFPLVSEKFNFLFGEEIHLAEYFRKQGVSTVFTKRIEILHKEHTTTDKLSDGRKANFYNQSYRRILKYYL